MRFFSSIASQKSKHLKRSSNFRFKRFLFFNKVCVWLISQ
ncbi:hypothetical protein [uncultured Gammaproteobacteria bacterium]|nr:hypothetical protein [uncultured Gammaproteobacteria bacterium]